MRRISCSFLYSSESGSIEPSAAERSSGVMQLCLNRPIHSSIVCAKPFACDTREKTVSLLRCLYAARRSTMCRPSTDRNGRACPNRSKSRSEKRSKLNTSTPRSPPSARQSFCSAAYVACSGTSRIACSPASRCARMRSYSAVLFPVCAPPRKIVNAPMPPP